MLSDKLITETVTLGATYQFISKKDSGQSCEDLVFKKNGKQILRSVSRWIDYQTVVHLYRGISNGKIIEMPNLMDYFDSGKSIKQFFFEYEIKCRNAKNGKLD